MKIFVIGTGGKQHSILWKLAQSKRVEKLFCTFENPEIQKLAEFVDIKENNAEELFEFIKSNKIDLTMIESSATMDSNLARFLRKANIPVIGGGQDVCKIEEAKGFSKKFFYKYKIPTPSFGVFDKEKQAIDHARKSNYPLVIKFDSRTSGLNSIICETFNQAKNAILFCLNNLYKPIVIEDFIAGKHITFHAITDGYQAIPLSTSYVYKHANNGNSGLITEGVGAYAPVSFLDEQMENKLAQKIFFPLIDALNAEKLNFAGILKANIVIDAKNNPYLLGVNFGFGDPEAQTILPLLEDDLAEILYSAAIGALSDDYQSFNISEDASVCVVISSGGYPSDFKKGFVIEGLDQIDNDNTTVFHSGTTKNVYEEIITDSGRVLSIVSTASTLHGAYDEVYESVELIKFNNMKYRNDIAKYLVLSNTMDL